MYFVPENNMPQTKQIILNVLKLFEWDTNVRTIFLFY